MPAAVLGLDIGGANLKVAHTAGIARSESFALWKHPDRLQAKLAGLIASMPPADRLAVTMTGELCDCWASKQAGVQAILDAVGTLSGSRPVSIWTNDGSFVDLSEGRSRPYAVASANWLALATYAGRFAPAGPALLIDIGTTTTDYIPLRDGVPVPTGRTDSQRMAAHELVYVGWRRTPLCAILLHSAAEWFATTHDLMLLTDLVSEDPSDTDTADGKPATKAYAAHRLARMWCSDPEELRFEETVRVAFGSLVARILAPLQALLLDRAELPATILLSGSGEFLARAVLSQEPKPLAAELVSLTAMLGPTAAAAACARAVAILCAERAS